MTEKQKEIYKFIQTYIKKHGEVPSCIVAAKHFEISRQAMNKHYEALIEEKKIRKNPVLAHYLICG